MASTINISIDYLKIQGARKVTKEDKDYVLIDIGASRAKHFKREGKEDSVYVAFTVKANQNGEDKFGHTHSICEAMTKEERQAKQYTPFIGSGRELVFDGGAKTSTRQPSQHGAVPAKQHPLMQDDSFGQGDEIPF